MINSKKTKKNNKTKYESHDNTYVKPYKEYV